MLFLFTLLWAYLFKITVQALRAIATYLNVDPRELSEMVGSQAMPDPHDSINSNLSLFHYFDKFMSYTTPQVRS